MLQFEVGLPHFAERLLQVFVGDSITTFGAQDESRGVFHGLVHVENLKDGEQVQPKSGHVFEEMEHELNTQEST